MNFPMNMNELKVGSEWASRVSKNDFLMCKCEVFRNIQYKLDERAKQIRNANFFLMFSENIMGEKFSVSGVRGENFSECGKNLIIVCFSALI